MNLQAKHWDKLFGNLTTEGTARYGVWTVYSPEQEVIKSSKGIRILQANEDQTVITHTNQFPLPDGTTQEKQWKIEKTTCNLPDGLLHPADSSKRALALLEYGATAWVAKQFELGQRFSVELFLKHQDWNTSIGSIYDEKGCLEKILCLREHQDSFPDTPEAPRVTQLLGTWQGTQQSVRADLNQSDPQTINELVLDPTQGKNQTFCLPDGVVVTIPLQLTVGEDFEIVAGKLVTANEYQRLTAHYDSSGKFSRLVLEIFHRQS